MTTEWLYKTISLAIILVLFYLFYQVISPFLMVIAWAMVLSITFYPLYRLFSKYARPWLSSLITLIIILVIILGPFSYITGALVNEITDVYSGIEEKGFETIATMKDHPRLAALFEKIASYKVLEGFDVPNCYVNDLYSWVRYETLSRR